MPRALGAREGVLAGRLSGSGVYEAKSSVELQLIRVTRVV